MHNGAHHTAQHVELGDRIVVAATAPGASAARELEFEVVGLVADEADAGRFAVCYCESADEFMVADAFGALLDDETLAQAILNDFLAHDTDLQEGD